MAAEAVDGASRSALPSLVPEPDPPWVRAIVFDTEEPPCAFSPPSPARRSCCRCRRRRKLTRPRGPLGQNVSSAFEIRGLRCLPRGARSSRAAESNATGGD